MLLFLANFFFFDQVHGRSIDQNQTLSSNDEILKVNRIFDSETKDFGRVKSSMDVFENQTSPEMVSSQQTNQSEPNAASSNDIVLMAALKGNSPYPPEVMYRRNGFNRGDEFANEIAPISIEEEKLLEEEKIIENEKMVIEDEKALLEEEKMLFNHHPYSMSDFNPYSHSPSYFNHHNNHRHHHHSLPHYGLDNSYDRSSSFYGQMMPFHYSNHFNPYSVACEQGYRPINHYRYESDLPNYCLNYEPIV